jgi:hypothetical protein
MALGPVLVVGLDPVRIRGWDPEPVVAAITRGQARFGDHSVEADYCLVAPDENAEGAIVEALTRRTTPAWWLGRSPEDTADAALRWLR